GEEPARVALERGQPLHAGAHDLDLPQHQGGHADARGGERCAAPAPRRAVQPRRIPFLARAPLLLGRVRVRGRLSFALSAVRKLLLRWVAVVALATGLAAGLARTEWHSGLENVYYDYWHVL